MKTMDRIKSMKQLGEQKIRLEARRCRLEKDMRLHWNELKEGLHPGSIEKEQGGHNNRIVKNTVQYGLMLLTQKITGKAEEKIKKMFRK